MRTRTLSWSAATALAGLAAAAAGVAGAAPDAETGPTGAQPVRIELTRHAGHARFASARVSVEMTCADGTRIARTVYLPGTRVNRHGEFTMSDMSGGNYGSDGNITVWVSLAGRLVTERHATGSFEASALVVEGEWQPAVSCLGGRLNWSARGIRSRRPG